MMLFVGSELWIGHRQAKDWKGIEAEARAILSSVTPGATSVNWNKQHDYPGVMSAIINIGTDASPEVWVGGARLEQADKKIYLQVIKMTSAGAIDQ